MNKRVRTQLFFEFLVDLICMFFANVVSIFIFSFVIKKIPTFPLEEWIKYDATLLLSYMAVFFGFHNNLDIQVRDRKKEIRSQLQNATLTFALFSVAIVMLKNRIVESRYMLVSGYVLFVAFSLAGRYFLKRYITRFYTKSKTALYIGIITTSDRAQEFIDSLKNDWSLNIRGIALLDSYVKGNSFVYNQETEQYGLTSPVSAATSRKLPKEIDEFPVINIDSDFMEWIRSAPLDEVFINLPYADDSEVQELIEELEDMGITVHINIPMLDDILGKSKFNNINCRMLYGSPMATFKASKQNYIALAIKRAFDILLGIIGCILSVPIIAITAIPLKLESKGPLFFKQLRVGKNGRMFYIYKLRSMYEDAEERKKELLEKNEMDGLMFKMDNDPRITKVGRVIRRLSIDELPQFYNVVRGDMSLIGTRPPTVDEFNEYESRHKRRLSMRPGISGMWQVSGRSDIQDFEEVVRLDCQYIDEWSLWLDAKIIFKTIGVVITGKGAE